VTEQDELKQQAALAALALVQSGMTLGLGTGSTAKYFVARLGERMARGALTDIRGVPTSSATAQQAAALGIPLSGLTAEGVDLAVDGMDEYDDQLNAIKGLGGALLREKVVAAAAAVFVLIGDSTKHVARLGDKAPLPVEVAVFGWRRTARRLEDLGALPTVRMAGGEEFLSDNGNLVLDCSFPDGLRPAELARALCDVPGVLEHGMFLGMADRAFVATATGTLELLGGNAR